MEMKKKRQRSRWRESSTWIMFLLSAVSICFCIQLLCFGILELKIQIFTVIAVIGGNLLSYYFMFHVKKGTVTKTAGRILAVFLSIILLIGTAVMYTADSVLNKMTEMTVMRRDLSVIVLKDSPVQKAEELTEEHILAEQTGMSADGKEYIRKMLAKQKADPFFETEENLNTIVEKLYRNEIDGMILDESYRVFIEDTYEDFSSDTRILYSVGYETKQNNISRKCNVQEDPFLVLISGIDTYGAISTVSRSDVNILAAVNPKTAQILLVSIPRDYYVPIKAGAISIAAPDGTKDKLTHSGLFGTQCTVRTVENLFGIPINYYVKVNFSSVVEIVDAVGGITVQSDSAFGTFQQGDNELNGEEALLFARERYAFESGDRQRGVNQMRVIQAMIKKLSAPDIDYDYLQLFRTVQSSIEMNFSEKEIKELIQLQIRKMPAWNVQTISVNGSDGTGYSYFYGDDLYVMYPDETSVETAEAQLRNILELEEETIND